jgi:hypothetical protein
MPALASGTPKTTQSMRVHPRQRQKWVAEDEGGNLGGKEDFNMELELMMENVT